MNPAATEPDPSPASAALKRRRDPQLWLTSLVSDLTLRICTVFTLVLIVMPGEGLGFDACLSRLATKAPCPGCGMTRCGANLVRGDVTRAVQYHPFGVIVIPAIVVLGVVGLLPRRWREGVRARAVALEPSLRPLWWFAFGSFMLYGALRWAAVVLGLVDFPPSLP